MIPANLNNLLKSRRKYVDEVSDIVEGQGSSLSSSSTFQELQSSKPLGSQSYTEKSISGFTGLINQGATCYLNSLIQSLYMLPDFRQAIYDFPYDASVGQTANETCIIRQLQKLFVLLQLSERAAVSTSALTKSFGWTSHDSFTQQDVNECMTVIFDYLNEKCSGTILGDYLTTSCYGQAYDYLRCESCGRSRGRINSFRDLNWQVRGHPTLEDSLRSYLREELLDEVVCENCSQKTTHRKGISFLKLPEILPIQLGRFEFNYSTMTRMKVNDAMTFPTVLGMSAYVSAHPSHAVGEGASEAAADDDVASRVEKKVEDHDVEDGYDNEGDDHAVVYDLVSVLVHTGSAFAGHYYCYSLVQDDAPISVEPLPPSNSNNSANSSSSTSTSGGSSPPRCDGYEESSAGAAAAIDSVAGVANDDVPDAGSGSKVGRWLLFNDSTVQELSDKQRATALGLEHQVIPTTTATATANTGSCTICIPDTDTVAGSVDNSSPVDIHNNNDGNAVAGAASLPIAPGSTGAYMLLYQRRRKEPLHRQHSLLQNDHCGTDTHTVHQGTGTTIGSTDTHTTTVGGRRRRKRVWRIPVELRAWVDDDNMQYRKAKATWLADKEFLNIRIIWKQPRRRRRRPLFVEEQEQIPATAATANVTATIDELQSSSSSPSLSHSLPQRPIDDSSLPASSSSAGTKQQQQQLCHASIRIHESSTIQHLVDKAIDEFKKGDAILVPEDISQCQIILKVFDAVRGVAAGLLNEHGDVSRTLKSLDQTKLRKPLLLEIIDPSDPHHHIDDGDKYLKFRAVLTTFTAKATAVAPGGGRGELSLRSVHLSKPVSVSVSASSTVKEALLTAANKLLEEYENVDKDVSLLTTEAGRRGGEDASTNDSRCRQINSSSPFARMMTRIDQIAACTVCTATGMATAFPAWEKNDSQISEMLSAHLRDQGEEGEEVLYISIHDEFSPPGDDGSVSFHRTRLLSYFDDLYNTVSITYDLLIQSSDDADGEHSSRSTSVSCSSATSSATITDTDTTTTTWEKLFYFPTAVSNGSFNAAALLPSSSSPTSGVIKIDRRKPIAELKAALAAKLNLTVGRFSLRKGGNYYCCSSSSSAAAGSSYSLVSSLMHSSHLRFGYELKDMCQSLQSAGVEDGTRIFVSPLSPLLCTQFRVRVLGVTASVVTPGTNMNAGKADEAAAAVVIQDMSLELNPYYMGTIVVSVDDTARDVKDKIHRLVTEQQQQLQPPQEKKPLMRLRLCEMITGNNEGGVGGGVEFKLTSMLRDGRTLQQLFNIPAALSSSSSLPTVESAYTTTNSTTVNPTSVTPQMQSLAHVIKYNSKKPALTDDTCIAVQFIPGAVHHPHTQQKEKDEAEVEEEEDEEECAEDHVLVSTRYWDISGRKLLPRVEHVFRKSMTIRELKAALLQRPQILSTAPAYSSSSSTAVIPGEKCELSSEDTTDIQIAKPFTWQLKELSSLHTLKWSQSQQHFDARIDAAPWRLQEDGAVLVVRSLQQAQAAGLSEDGGDNHALVVAAGGVGDNTRETGFRLYSQGEQRERVQREAQEVADRKATIEETMKRMLQLRPHNHPK